MGLWAKGTLQFPGRAHARVVGQIPGRGWARGNHTLIFLSLSFTLPFPLSKSKINKIFLKKSENTFIQSETLFLLLTYKIHLKHIWPQVIWQQNLVKNKIQPQLLVRLAEKIIPSHLLFLILVIALPHWGFFHFCIIKHFCPFALAHTIYCVLSHSPHHAPPHTYTQIPMHVLKGLTELYLKLKITSKFIFKWRRQIIAYLI